MLNLADLDRGFNSTSSILGFTNLSTTLNIFVKNSSLIGRFLGVEYLLSVCLIKSLITLSSSE